MKCIYDSENGYGPEDQDPGDEYSDYESSSFWRDVHYPDEYIYTDDEHDANILPNEKSIIIDNRLRDKEREWKRDTEKDWEKYRYDESLVPKSDTHFFDCRLLPVDMEKLLPMFPDSPEDSFVYSAIDSLRYEGDEYGIDFHYWLWLETGGNRTDKQVEGCDISNRNESKACSYPFEIYNWITGDEPTLFIYRRFMKSKSLLPGMEDLKQVNGVWQTGEDKALLREFASTHGDYLNGIPRWYLLKIRAIDIDDIAPNPTHVMDALTGMGYEYAELFLGRGDVKDVKDLKKGKMSPGAILADINHFKLLEKYMKIPYGEIKFSVDSDIGISRAYSFDLLYFYDRMLEIANWRKHVLHPPKELYTLGGYTKRNISIKSSNVVTYVILTGKLQDILPSLEIDLKCGRYTQESLQSRLGSICYLLDREPSQTIEVYPIGRGGRGEAAKIQEEKDQSERDTIRARAICTIEMTKDLLALGDCYHSVILKDTYVWIQQMCKYIACLRSIKTVYVMEAISMTAIDCPKISEILEQSVSDGQDESAAGNALKTFIRGWGSSITIHENGAVSISPLY